MTGPSGGLHHRTTVFIRSKSVLESVYVNKIRYNWPERVESGLGDFGLNSGDYLQKYKNKRSQLEA